MPASVNGLAKLTVAKLGRYMRFLTFYWIHMKDIDQSNFARSYGGQQLGQPRLCRNGGTNLWSGLILIVCRLPEGRR